jgi:protein N-lysine methyltransferase METTL21D
MLYIHSFILATRADGSSSGTAQWPASNVLAAFLVHLWRSRTTLNALELGAGVGFTSLVLANSLPAASILATDTSFVCNAVLRPNIAANPIHGTASSIAVVDLDWCRPVPSGIPPFIDAIFSSDTVYSHELIGPLLRTINSLSHASTVVYLALERRDPQLIDDFFQAARSQWGFVCSRVAPNRIKRSLKYARVEIASKHLNAVEVWKLRRPSTTDHDHDDNIQEDDLVDVADDVLDIVQPLRK